MMSIANPRRRTGQRISSALWGLLVAGVGVLLVASYSGYEIDLELAAIIVLGAIGGWLLLSAAVSGIGRKREISRATAPTVEERVEPGSQASGGAENQAADDAAGDDTGRDASEGDSSREATDHGHQHRDDNGHDGAGSETPRA